jgi:hypothetical protein
MSINISNLDDQNIVELKEIETTEINGAGGYSRRGYGRYNRGNNVSLAGLSQVGGAGLVGTSLQTVSASGNGGVAGGTSTAASLGYGGVATSGSGFGLAGGNVGANFNVTGNFDRT